MRLHSLAPKNKPQGPRRLHPWAASYLQRVTCKKGGIPRKNETVQKNKCHLVSSDFLQRFVGCFCVNNLMENSRRGCSPCEPDLASQQTGYKMFPLYAVAGSQGASVTTQGKKSHSSLGSWVGTICGGAGVCVECFPGRPFVCAAPGGSCWTLQGVAPLRWLKPGPPCPSPRAASGLQQWAGGRGQRKRLPEALSPSPTGCPRGQPGPETTDHCPCPPTSPPSAETSPGLGGSPLPCSGRSLGVRPPQPGWSGGGRGGEEGGSLAELLPRGRAAQAQTFPYVVAPRAGAAPGVVVGGGS